MKKILIWLTAFGCVITVGFNSRHAAPVSDSMALRQGPAVMGVKTIISGLDVPWQIIWGADNKIWMTEQNGAISKVDPETGERKVLLQIPDVYRKKSYGLLGMALAPDFEQHPYVFVDYTYLKPEALTDTARRDASILSKLVRYTYSNGTLTGPVVFA